jgi:hypothetical protein
LLAISWLSTPQARNRLTTLSRTSYQQDTETEIAAWKEITSLTTRYGISAFIVNVLIVIVPLFIIAQGRAEDVSSVFQPTSINSPIPIYILLAGLASTLGSTILTLLLIERFTLPDRLMLLPRDYEAQINGRAGALLGTKFQTMILGLIVIGITIIAPLGYQQTVRILYTEVSSLQVFSDLQAQSLLLSG